MPDDRRSFTQELVSAKYLADVAEPEEAEVEQPVRRAQPCRSGLEQAVRWLTPLVIVMLVAAAGGLYWQNRASISSSAGQFKKRSSSGIDLLLWASGSKKSFSEALTDKLKKSEYEFDQMKPTFKTQFDHVDFENAWSQQWNQKR